MTPAPELVTDFLRTLDRLGITYAIGGSFASSAWGQPRQTRDLDINVVLTSAMARDLGDALESSFLLSRTEIDNALGAPEPFPSFQLLHSEEIFKIDVFVVADLHYSGGLMARRRRYRLNSDYAAWFLSPEDIVIMKLRWFVLGNRVSDRQWNDIVQVLEAQWNDFDHHYAHRWAEHFEVAGELAMARSQVVLPKSD